MEWIIEDGMAWIEEHLTIWNKTARRGYRGREAARSAVRDRMI